MEITKPLQASHTKNLEPLQVKRTDRQTGTLSYNLISIIIEFRLFDFHFDLLSSNPSIEIHSDMQQIRKGVHRGCRMQLTLMTFVCCGHSIQGRVTIQVFLTLMDLFSYSGIFSMKMLKYILCIYWVDFLLLSWHWTCIFNNINITDNIFNILVIEINKNFKLPIIMAHG